MPANIRNISFPPNKTREKKQKYGEKRQTPRRRQVLFRGVWPLMSRSSPMSGRLGVPAQAPKRITVSRTIPMSGICPLASLMSRTHTLASYYYMYNNLRQRYFVFFIRIIVCLTCNKQSITKLIIYEILIVSSKVSKIVKVIC